MELKDIKYAYFLGIGGIGMSAIARYFSYLGIKIFGYDRVRSPLCLELEKEGMNIHYEDNYKLIPEQFTSNSKNSICIWTPALPKNHGEINFLKSNGFTIYKRAEVLGMISKNSFTIAVAGTHGKTTTTTMLAKALSSFDINFSAFLGGISSDFNTNFILKSNHKELFDKPIIVVEADEYDHSFLQLHPDIAIITSVDADHLDIYKGEKGFKKGFQEFTECIVKGGKLIINEKAELKPRSGIKSFTYGYNSNDDFSFDSPKHIENSFLFNWKNQNNTVEVELGIPGKHNAENATAVLGAIQLLGLDIKTATQGLSTFKGVKRRFEILFKDTKRTVIDDYAHHPTELNAIISSVKMNYPAHKLTGIFQPHLYSRTRDFMEGFVNSLSKLDECWLMDIYPARELPIEGITSQVLSQKIKNCIGVFTPDEIKNKIENNPPELLLIMGAGDIDRLRNPIKSIYEKLFA